MSNLDTSVFTILNQEAIESGIISEYGSNPYNRSMKEHLKYGMLILDKHAGPTSHEIVAIVKRILNVEKAGHSGTLDPNVTGVLPIGLNESTKILHTLLLAPKHYVCILRSAEPIEFDKWKALSANFNGLIYQVPPLKSNVVKALRKRRIYDITSLEVLDNEYLFEVSCQAGTYIRTLCIDMGKAIGTSSYMKELRRIQSGPFKENHCLTLTELFDAFEDYKDGLGEDKLRKCIIPIEDGIQHLPKIVLRDNAIDPVCHGSIINIPAIIAYQDFKRNELIALLSAKGELIGIGQGLQNSDLIQQTDNGSIIRPNRIVMMRGTYPKYNKT